MRSAPSVSIFCALAVSRHLVRRPTFSASSQPEAAVRIRAWRVVFYSTPRRTNTASTAEVHAVPPSGSTNSPSNVNSRPRALGAPAACRRESVGAGSAAATADDLLAGMTRAAYQPQAAVPRTRGWSSDTVTTAAARRAGKRETSQALAANCNGFGHNPHCERGAGHGTSRRSATGRSGRGAGFDRRPGPPSDRGPKPHYTAEAWRLRIARSGHLRGIPGGAPATGRAARQLHPADHDHPGTAHVQRYQKQAVAGVGTGRLQRLAAVLLDAGDELPRKDPVRSA